MYIKKNFTRITIKFEILSAQNIPTLTYVLSPVYYTIFSKIYKYLCLMKNDCNSTESSNTCESVRDSFRALSMHENKSS